MRLYIITIIIIMNLEEGRRLLLLEFQISIWAVVLYICQSNIFDTDYCIILNILTDMIYSL